jgi:hypothetical protein
MFRTAIDSIINISYQGILLILETTIGTPLGEFRCVSPMVKAKKLIPLVKFHASEKNPQLDEINIARSNIEIQSVGRQIIYRSGAARLRAEAGAIRIKGEWVKRGEGRGGGEFA